MEHPEPAAASIFERVHVARDQVHVVRITAGSLRLRHSVLKLYLVVDLDDGIDEVISVKLSCRAPAEASQDPPAIYWQASKYGVLFGRRGLCPPL